MFNLLWGIKTNQSSISNAHLKRAVGEEGRLSFCYAVAVLPLICCLYSNSSYAVTDDNIPFNIPQQRADLALTEFAEQANLTLAFPFDQVKDKIANRLVGLYPIDTAINLLLQDTGLTPTFSKQFVLHIAIENKGKNMDATNSKKRQTVLAGLVGLFAATGGMSSALAQGDDAAAQGRIDEIIVTANKREQSLQDTAMSISAIGGDMIDKRGLVGMDDYLKGIPGVNFQDRGAAQNSVVIRGMAADPQLEDSTAGVYLGETPLTGLAGANAFDFGGNADIKLVDVERIEVLRGPQGTLYGASSIAGTVRVIPRAPKLNRIEGAVSTGYSDTGERGSENTMLTGIINLPLIEDKLAVRAAAYHFENSGYIENIAGSQPNALIDSVVGAGGFAEDRGDVGGDEYTGYRVTALWQPTDEFNATLMYLQQEIEQDGFPEVNYRLDEKFQQIRPQVGENGSHYESLSSEVDITNLVLEYDFAWGDLVGSVSRINSDPKSVQDGSIFNPDFVTGNPTPYSTTTSNSTTVDVEELRFTSNFSGSIQILLGLYHEDRETQIDLGDRWSGDSSLGNSDDIAFRSQLELPVEQKAVFGELAYSISDKVLATFGARHFEFERENNSVLSFLGFVFSEEHSRAKSSDQTYKFNVSYQLTDDFLVYGQWAEGFRLGRPQTPILLACDPDGDRVVDGVSIPRAVNPDTSASFELGTKWNSMDKRVSINASIYQIDWEGMPVGVPASCGSVHVFNAGESVSLGAEIELQAYLTENFELSVGLSYNQSELTEDAPNLGNDGDDLPGSADINFNLGLEHGFDLGEYAAFSRLDYSYVGEYSSVIQPASNLPDAGGYSQINLNLGVNLGKFDVGFFANNLTNSDEFTWVETGLSAVGFTRAYRLRPRTIGANIKYHF